MALCEWNHYSDINIKALSEFLALSDIAKILVETLRKTGMNFVGPTDLLCIYAIMRNGK